jgi:CRP-like cAMP-binding protein
MESNMTETPQKRNISDDALLKRVTLIRQVEFFSELPIYVIAAVAEAAMEMTFGRDEIIVREGELGDCLFVVAEGTIKVTVQGQPIGTVRSGDVLGELSVLRSGPRNATATAKTQTFVLRIGSEIIDELLLDYPEVTRGIIASLVGRIRSQSSTLAVDV